MFVFIVDIYLKAFWDKCFEDGAHIFGREYAGRRFGGGGFTPPCKGFRKTRHGFHERKLFIQKI